MEFRPEGGVTRPRFPRDLQVSRQPRPESVTGGRVRSQGIVIGAAPAALGTVRGRAAHMMQWPVTSAD